MSRQRIHLHIEHLVVEGIDLGASGLAAFEAALQQQLVAALEVHALRASHTIESLPATSLTLSSRPDGTALGGGIAQSLSASLAGVLGGGAANDC